MVVYYGRKAATEGGGPQIVFEHEIEDYYGV